MDTLTLRTQAELIAAAIPPGHERTGRLPIEADAEKTQLLLASLTDGNYRNISCRIAGISEQSLSNAFKRAERGDTAATAFVEAIEKAEALAESKMVQAVRRAGEMPQYWAAAATHLERKSPDRWGKRQDDASVPRVVVQIGARDSDVSVTVATITTHEPDAIDVSAVDTTSRYDVSKLTEDSLSDADTRCIKVAATQKAEPSTPTRQRRGTSRGTHPVGRRATALDGADSGKGRR